jgi:Putative peptidoglycan binding domain
LSEQLGSDGTPGQWRLAASLLSTPLLLAIVGLLGTGLGAVLTGHENTKLERARFEFSLIKTALETPDKNEAGRYLKFLADAGLLTEFNSAKISSLADHPTDLPSLPDAGLRAHLITIKEVKTILVHLGGYTGIIDDVADERFRKAVAAFQSSQKIETDGLIGPATYAKLREAWPEYFTVKSE